VRTLKLTVAYDGTAYCGWQRQINGTSVQQRLEEALTPLTGEPPTVNGAGRTDAGVHAAAQVASVRVDIDHACDTIRRAVNVHLPADIRVLHVEDAPATFHARFNAIGKTYRYRMVTADVVHPFDRWFVWHVPGRFDVSAMRNALPGLVGTHDFAAFQAARTTITDTVRTIRRAELSTTEDGLTLDVEGDGFLRHQVRTMMGTLVDVGAGRRGAASLSDLLRTRDRSQAGDTAPARGLTLVRVHY
jgi:tRNA pseudouridine38-40 synthase